MRLKFNGDSS